MSDQFIVKRLRSKPVEYTVRIRHFIIDGEWHMGATVMDVAEDDVNKDRVASDLRAAATILDGRDPEWELEEEKRYADTIQGDILDGPRS